MVLSHLRLPFVVTFRAIVVIIIVLRVAMRWLSTEVEPARESLSARAAAEAASPEAASGSTKAAAIHHAEKNFWVNTAMHSTAATAAEHVRRVDQVFAAVITSAFPTCG